MSLVAGWARALCWMGLGVSATGYAQVFDLSKGPPIVQLPVNAPAKPAHPAALTDVRGLRVSIIYDHTGRVSRIKVGPRRNRADMIVRYDAGGRLRAVVTDSGYQLNFDWRSDGTEEIRDSLGNTATRARNAEAQYVLKSANDPRRLLAGSLRRLEWLFAHIQAVEGLNPVKTPG